MSTFADRIFRISFHQSECLHTVYHDTGRQFVYVHIRNTRAESFYRFQMHRILNLVYFALAGCKLLVGRNGRRHIACIA